MLHVIFPKEGLNKKGEWKEKTGLGLDIVPWSFTTILHIRHLFNITC